MSLAARVVESRSGRLGMKRVVAVFGLSGVGKSTTVSRVVTAADGVATSINAGDLIRRRRSGGAQELRQLSAGEIQSNQELLIKEVAAERTRPGPPILLLDGHCVIDNGEELVRIPVGVIERLGLSAIVYLTADACEIRERRRLDSGRTRPDLDTVEVARHQEVGLAACTSYSVELELPTMVVSAAEHELVAMMVGWLAGAR